MRNIVVNNVNYFQDMTEAEAIRKSSRYCRIWVSVARSRGFLCGFEFPLKGFSLSVKGFCFPLKEVDRFLRGFWFPQEGFCRILRAAVHILQDLNFR
jgi:hypothetical protein